MPTNVSGSAKIYAFPSRGRFLARSTPETVEVLSPQWQEPAVRIASGSGWYHEEAIAQAHQELRQTEPRRKN